MKADRIKFYNYGDGSTFEKREIGEGRNFRDFSLWSGDVSSTLLFVHIIISFFPKRYQHDYFIFVLSDCMLYFWYKTSRLSCSMLPRWTWNAWNAKDRHGSLCLPTYQFEAAAAALWWQAPAAVFLFRWRAWGGGHGYVCHSAQRVRKQRLLHSYLLQALILDDDKSAFCHEFE